jgi:hypothetical protein
MLNSISLHFVRLGVASIVGIAGSIALAQPTPEPVIVRPPVIVLDPLQPSRLPADAERHLAVTVTITKAAVKIVSIKPGNGPPRAYLSDRSTQVVLIRSVDGEILSRTNLPDPLQLRIWDSPSSGLGTRSRSNTSKETVTTARSAQLTLFLPALPGAKVIEFRAGNERGRLLGKADIPG